MKRIIPVPVILLAAITSCGPRSYHETRPKPVKLTTQAEPAPRLDATSEMSIIRSQLAISASLTPEEDSQFQDDLILHMKAYGGPYTRSLPADTPALAPGFMAPLHGMTAAEIHLKARAEARQYHDANIAAAIARGKPELSKIP